MQLEKLNFLGFLANVDSSILKVDFGHGVLVGRMTMDDAFEFVSKLHNISNFGVFLNLTRGITPVDNEYFVLTAQFDSDGSRLGTFEFENSQTRPLLDEFLPKLRLFREGNIQMPLYYYYPKDSRPDSPRSIVGPGVVAYGPSFHIEEAELNDLKEFTRSTRLPFQEESLNLALQSYEMSYTRVHINLAFLVLMIGIESLLNPSKGEITYRVSRYAALLLGNSQDEGASIFKEMKELYRTRSVIVHGASKIVVKDSELTRLRGILRGLIKAISTIDKPKDELLRMLDYLGFGESPWRRKC